MSVSAIFGMRLTPTPLYGATTAVNQLKLQSATSCTGGGGGLALIECSSRPQKKSTAHHMKTRPKKTQPWDKKRGPAVYAPLPPLPAEWTLVSSASDEAAPVEAVEAVVEAA